MKEKFEGPYQVVKVLNEGRNYELRLDEKDQSFSTFHISKLKIYRPRYFGVGDTRETRNGPEGQK